MEEDEVYPVLIPMELVCQVRLVKELVLGVDRTIVDWVLRQLAIA